MNTPLTDSMVAQAITDILAGDEAKARYALAGTTAAYMTLHELQGLLISKGGHGLDTLNLEVSREHLTEPVLRMGAGTPLACTACHRVGMSVYYLKRSNGKYDVLCSDNGNGCYEHSARSLCTYIDKDEAQCTDLAEFMVVYGVANDLMRRTVCSRHVPAVLGGAPVYVLYPLDSEYLRAEGIV